MLEDDLKALRRAVEELTRAINESTALLTSASLGRAAESKQYELERDTTEAAPLPPLIAPVDEVTHQTMSEPDFRALMLTMSRAGHKDELRAKLAEYNVEKAGDLKGAARESYIEWLITLAERA
jgi:hypothetical protein